MTHVTTLQTMLGQCLLSEPSVLFIPGSESGAVAETHAVKWQRKEVTEHCTCHKKDRLWHIAELSS